jgi:hypothetical protein
MLLGKIILQEYRVGFVPLWNIQTLFFHVFPAVLATSAIADVCPCESALVAKLADTVTAPPGLSETPVAFSPFNLK